MMIYQGRNVICTNKKEQKIIVIFTGMKRALILEKGTSELQ